MEGWNAGLPNRHAIDMTAHIGKSDFAPAPTERELTLLFVLLPQFSQLSFTASVETLVRANDVAGRRVFSWTTCSVDGGPVRSSLGMAFPVDHGPAEVHRDTVVILIGGNRYEASQGVQMTPWLRRVDRAGCMIGAIGSATFLLAEASLLRCASVAVPWESVESFAETFPEIEMSDGVLTQSPRQFTALGGVFAIDLMLLLMSRLCSTKIADEVAKHANYVHVRRLNRHASTKRSWRLGVKNGVLREAINLMEANLEEKQSTEAIARCIGISQRQYQRICKRELGRTPTQIYRQIQLEKAKCLLLQTPLSISEIALASGFASPSNFARLFRRHFGITAHELRS